MDISLTFRASAIAFARRVWNAGLYQLNAVNFLAELSGGAEN
jgi:hypothetical protein